MLGLAYRLWEERGWPLGSPDDDWFRAEPEFIQRSDSPSRPPFSSLMTEPLEYLKLVMTPDTNERPAAPTVFAIGKEMAKNRFFAIKTVHALG